MTEKDYEYAKQAFDQYYEAYKDLSQNISHKYEHSYRVAQLMEVIAKRLGYLENDVTLAKIIGLLHDLGRFEQLKQTQSFNDQKFDHANYAVTYLFELGHISDFISTRKYDTIIKDAIDGHNRYELSPSISEESRPFCQLIRDADKIDIYEVCGMYYEDTFDGKISPEVKEEFQKGLPVHKTKVHTDSDSILQMMAFVYDFNYDESFDILVETDNFGFWLSTLNVLPQAEEEFRQLVNQCYQKIERGV